MYVYFLNLRISAWKLYSGLGKTLAAAVTGYCYDLGCYIFCIFHRIAYLQCKPAFLPGLTEFEYGILYVVQDQ